MKCPVCVIVGKKSMVYLVPGGTITAVYYPPFWDEDGREHNHDANARTSGYSCTNGHKWTETTHGSCWCGWSGGEKTVTVKE